MSHGKYEMIDMSSAPEITIEGASKTRPYISTADIIPQIRFADERPIEPFSTKLLETEIGTEESKFYDHERNSRVGFFGQGWRGGLIRWTVLSTVIWVANIIVYIYLFVSTDVEHGSGVVMTSTCTSVSVANTVVHLALNLVSSLMLSASAYAQESLCCPTRAEVDDAHASGRWLDVGGLSLRNFRFISKTRSVLWVALWTTSIPLHLFFNAVFFTSSQTHQYAVAVVNTELFSTTAFVPDIDSIKPSNFANMDGYPDEYLFERPNDDVLVALIEDAKRNDTSSNLAILDREQCMSTYANGFVRTASDVAVVVNNTTLDRPLIWTRYPARSISADRELVNQDGFNWICRDVLAGGIQVDNEISDRCTPDIVEFISDSGNWTVYGSPVQSCLSRPQIATCHLLFNVYLMLTVLVIGICKTLMMVYIILRLSKQHNLRTFGDAIASFLQHEDPTTRGLCLISSKTFVKHGLSKQPPQLYSRKQHRWWRSAGVKQFSVTLIVTTICAALLGVGLSFAVDGAFGAAFDFPLGQANIQSLAKVQADDVGSSGIVPNLITANIPQLVFSLLYMAYNDVLSKMLMGHEFNKYARRRMPLRVSEQPRGLQRGTRYFSLPMRWALSLMALGALLHWLASQALFAVRVDGVDNNNVVDPQDQLSRLGYNARAIAALIVVLVFVVGALAYIGWCKKFDVNFGEMGNSLVISAACHPHRTGVDDHQMHLRELSWGDVTDCDTPPDHIRHCSFADRDPAPLRQGIYYA